MDRREFFIKGAGLFALPLVITQIGCDETPTNSEMNDDDTNDNPANGGDQNETFSVTSSVDRNHTHSVEIKMVNIDTPPAMEITLTSSATDHSHKITLTPNDYQTLQAGETVIKTSTTDSGHSHTFSIEVPDS